MHCLGHWKSWSPRSHLLALGDIPRPQHWSLLSPSHRQVCAGDRALHPHYATSTSHPGGKPPAAADRPGCTVAFSAKHTDTSRSWCCSAIPPGEQLRCFVLLLPAKRRQLLFGESSGLEQPGRSMTWDLPHGPPRLHPPRHRLAKPRSHNSQAFFQEHGQGLAWAGAPLGRSCSRKIPERSPGLAPSQLLPSKLHFSYKWSAFGPIL